MKERLLKQGADAARRAIRHYLNGEHDQFFIQAGVSFELLGKARLAAIHPSLIIDKDFDSLLHACAAGKHSKRAPWNVKTITATDVLQRSIQLQPELRTFEPRLKLLAEYRNSTIHLGEVPMAEVKQLFRAYLACCSALAIGLELKPEKVFSEFTGMVLKQLDESLAEVQRVVSEKIARAKDDFRIRYSALDSDQLKALVNLIESRNQTNMEKYQDELVVCPACEHMGITSGDYDLDWDVDYDREGGISGGSPIVTLKPLIFICNVCGLTLDDASELKAAGLEDSIDIEDVDPADFCDEPDDY
jgi:hypothetical protein